MSQWPSDLPQHPSITGYSHGPVDRVLRSSISYGPDHLRRVKSPALSLITLQMVMTKAQYNSLVNFYLNTIDQVGDVDWYDHLNTDSPQDSAVYKFASSPTMQHISGDNWLVTMTMETR